MSRCAVRPFSVSILLSLSNSSIFSKLSLPTPTIMMDNGSEEAAMIAVIVRSMSVITPSVMISRIYTE